MITLDWEPIPWAIFQAKKYKCRVYKVHTADNSTILTVQNLRCIRLAHPLHAVHNAAWRPKRGQLEPRGSVTANLMWRRHGPRLFAMNKPPGGTIINHSIIWLSWHCMTKLLTWRFCIKYSKINFHRMLVRMTWLYNRFQLVVEPDHSKNPLQWIRDPRINHIRLMTCLKQQNRYMRHNSAC